jgi:hypothetical protein
MRKVHAEHGPIQAELRGLVEPLSAHLAEQIYSDTVDWDPVSNWESSRPDIISTDLPYNDDMRNDPYTLPPHIFGLNPSEADLVIPEPQELSALAVRFIQNRPKARGYYSQTVDSYVTDQIPERLDNIREHGQPIDPKKWSAYRAAADKQLDHFYHIEHAMMHRNGNVQSFLDNQPQLSQHPALRKYDAYMYTSTDSLFTSLERNAYRSSLTGFPIMPIGEYGPAFARDVLATTHYAIERANLTCADLADDLARGHETVITTYMARGRDLEPNEPAGDALLLSLEEGVLSVMQTIALLTAEKVPGYDDPKALLHDIVENGLIEQFTRAVPMGLVGPFALAGRHFNQPLQVTERGLQLHPDLLAILKPLRYRQIASMMLLWEKFHDGTSDEQPSALGTICPAAFAHGAVTDLSKAMLVAFEKIDKPAARRKRAGRLLVAAVHSGTSAMAA